MEMSSKMESIFHLSHRTLQSVKHRSGDDALADVELFDGFDFDDGGDVVIVEPVSGGDMQTHLGGIDAEAPEGFELVLELFFEFGARPIQPRNGVVGASKIAV